MLISTCSWRFLGEETLFGPGPSHSLDRPVPPTNVRLCWFCNRMCQGRKNNRCIRTWFLEWETRVLLRRNEETLEQSMWKWKEEVGELSKWCDQITRVPKHVHLWLHTTCVNFAEITDHSTTNWHLLDIPKQKTDILGNRRASCVAPSMTWAGYLIAYCHVQNLRCMYRL